MNLFRMSNESEALEALDVVRQHRISSNITHEADISYITPAVLGIFC